MLTLYMIAGVLMWSYLNGGYWALFALDTGWRAAQ